jgi:3',5'-cyclic-AMP phosphodiesterase
VFSLAHVSDLHVSTFGDTFHDRKGLVKRSKVPATSQGEPVGSWKHWRVVRAFESGKLQLIDAQGYGYTLGPKIVSADAAARVAAGLEERRSDVLARQLPNDGELATMLGKAPHNANLRLLLAANELRARKPDAVFITGDVTDDGFGWELVSAVFAPWIEKKRLFVVPGNHDVYTFPMQSSGRPKPTKESKRQAWRAFAAQIGIELDPVGAWFHALAEASTVLVGLDSCANGQPAFFRHNGAVGKKQMDYLRSIARSSAWQQARHRIVGLHHHVVPLPPGVGLRASPELGMRLDDAKKVAALFDEIGVTLVLHGHRHISEERKPAGTKFRILSAPSLTLGCRSGDGPSYWQLELGERLHAERIAIEALEAAPESVR